MKQNLVFIMTDQQRADTLGMKSGNTEVTPALNQLAGESTVLERAYNTCPLCVPARNSYGNRYESHKKRYDVK